MTYSGNDQLAADALGEIGEAMARIRRYRAGKASIGTVELGVHYAVVSARRFANSRATGARLGWEADVYAAVFALIGQLTLASMWRRSVMASGFHGADADRLLAARETIAPLEDQLRCREEDQ